MQRSGQTDIAREERAFPPRIRNMPLRALFASLLGFASLVTVACGADPDAPTDDPCAPTAETLACTRFAQAKCARTLACDPTYDSYAVRPRVTCEAEEVSRCLETMAPGAGQTIEGLDTCTAALPTAACGRLSVVDLPAACAPVRGRFANDSSCHFDAQCASGVCLTDFDACGVCVEAKGEGTPCDPSKSVCGEGLICDLVLGKCVRIIRVGEPCEQKDILRCESKRCVDGTCREPLLTGEACDEKKNLCTIFHDCQKGVCQPLTIDNATQEIGQSCGADAAGAMCRIGAHCVVPDETSPANGRCAPQGLEGEPCVYQGLYENPCIQDHVCVSGVCRRDILKKCH